MQRACLRSAAGTNPQTPRTPELCKKGLELDRGLGCFVLLLSQLGFRNWQNWAVRTRPGCKLGLPVGGPCRSGKGERIRLPSRPSPASGRGTPLPGTHLALRAPRASRVSRNLLVAQDSTGEAPTKDRMEGVNASKSPWTHPVHPRPGILQPPYRVKQQGVLLLFLFFFFFLKAVSTPSCFPP